MDFEIYEHNEAYILKYVVDINSILTVIYVNKQNI